MESRDKTYRLNAGDDSRPLMVHVKAPASLPAGYTFEALVNDDPDRPFTCEVPDGGVQEGQSFLAPVPPSASKVRIEAPTGKWKDGLFDCFKYGVLHPHLWCALCCSRLAMAQIMTRMQLSWLGEPGALVATKNTFKVVVILIASYIFFTTAIEIGTLEYSDVDVPLYIVITKLVASSMFSIWSIYSMCRTRQSVRARYSIPEERCVGYEDCCMSFWCTCCTVAQMARHTGEYEAYPHVFFSTSGHPPGTPLTV